MSKLIYITNMSVDGYIADESGDFHWDNPEQIHPTLIELLRPIGTYLYGRRLYELMAFWDGPVEGYPHEHRPFAQTWQKAEKIVFSRTLTTVATRKTRLEHEFGVETIRKLKHESEHDFSIGGAELAALAFEAGLVDECQLFVHPVILGGGKPAFRGALRRKLKLIEARRVGTGVSYLRYRCAEPGSSEASYSRSASA